MLQKLDTLKLKLIDSVASSLSMRGAKPRSEGDDTLFVQFNTFLATVTGQGLERFVIDTFRGIEEMVTNFEQAHTTEIHKGSIFFNIDLFYFWSGDFDNALYYWQKAIDEDKKTVGKVAHNIFQNDLFKYHFETIIQPFITTELSKENSICTVLTGNPFEIGKFFVYLNQINPHHVMSILVNIYRCIRCSYF